MEKPKIRFLFVIGIVIGLSITGCGGKVTPTPSTEPTGQVEKLDSGVPLPPQVIEQKPLKGEELLVDGYIEITFDQPMNQAVTSAAWQLRGPVTEKGKGEILAGETSWPNFSILRFTPSVALRTGATYVGTLTTAASSVAGLALPEALTFEFTTLGELQVSQVFPADKTSDVENSAVVTVMFNRPVVPLVISAEQAKLPQPLTLSPKVSGKGEWLNTSIYIFHPDKPFKGSTTYTAKIGAGLTDPIGATLAKDYEWQFTIAAPSIAELQLPDLVTNPENNYTNVPLDQAFSILFRQPMDQTSFKAAVSLASDKGEAVPSKLIWNEDNTQATIKPLQRLALGTTYNLKLDKTAQEAGGGSLSEGLEWTFTTVLPPAIAETMPGNGWVQTFFSDQLTIYFASQMNLDSLKDKVIITPDLDREDWYYSEWERAIYFYGLRPSTRYQVKIIPGMADIYGNQITKGLSFSFTTAPYSPSVSLEMPYAPAIYRSARASGAGTGTAPTSPPMEFYVRYVNTNVLEFELYQLTAEQFASMNNGDIYQGDFIPNEQDLIRKWRFSARGKLNDYSLTPIPLETGKAGPLPNGFYFLGLNSVDIPHDSRFLDTRLFMVANTNLTFKMSDTDALVWMTDLESGAPIANAPVALYDRNFQSIEEGSTDNNGLVYFKGLKVEKKIEKAETYSQRFVMVGNNPDGLFGVASSDWGSGVSPYDFGIWSDYYTSSAQVVAYIYTDRPLYRPGQPVSFKGIVRMSDDLAYSLPPGKEVIVKITSYDETIYEETLPLSSFGSFFGQLTLDKEAALGSYTISVQFPEEELVLGSVDFNVAEYRKPEFQVTISTEKPAVLASETFSVTVNAEYYSGGGVKGAEVDWALSSTTYTFSPTGELGNYNFSDISIGNEYNEYYAPQSEIIAEGQDVTDEDGQLILPLPADLNKAKTSQEFTVEATVTDLSGNAVSGRTNIIAHASKIYAGIKAREYIGIVNQEQSFDLVAVDWDGKPIPGQPLYVDIVEERWSSVQEQDPSGNIQWKSTVEEIPISNFTGIVSDKEGKASVSFTPPNGGTFKATITTRDDQGNQSRAATIIWVSGAEYIAWQQTNDRGFKLVADRNAYMPGDNAEILIASPFQGENYALVTIERGHIRSYKVLKLTSNSTIYKLPLTVDMAPNIYVSVVIVKGVNMQLPAGHSSTTPVVQSMDNKPDFKVGMLEIKVDTNQQAVKVDVTADHEQAGPGEQVTYTVHTTNFQEKPVSAEVSLALTDLATLSLSGPNTAPILNYFFSERSLGVRTSVPIVLGIENFNAVLKEQVAEGRGGGSGGAGKGGGEFGVIEVRQEFPDTAYWKADVLTNEKGEASVTVKLPDNLTIWRMDARAVTQDTRVGQTTLDIRTTKPLLVRPQTPRFFVAGDKARLGAAVHNNTDGSLNVDVKLQATGVTILSDNSQTVIIPAKSQVYVYWDVSVDLNTNIVDPVFMAKGGDYQDASRPTLGNTAQEGLPVYRYSVPETVGTAGMIMQGEALSQTEAISLPTDFGSIQSGELSVQVSPSLAASLTDGLEFLTNYPYECTEQTISRFLPNVLTTRALASLGITDQKLQANLKEQVGIGLQRLYNQQNPDGGWGWWSGGKSNVQTSAYVIFGLVEAKSAGYTVSEDVLKRGLDYLHGNLVMANNLDAHYLLNRQAFVLYVLARAGKPEISNTVQLYDVRQSLSTYARAYLAMTMYIIDSNDPRLDTLRSDFVNAAILSATGAHWEESWLDYWNWNTDTRTTAIVLAAMIQIDPQNTLNANAVRWLMNHRTGGHWATTQETAWTLIGLSNWMINTGELKAAYNYAVALNGERLGEGWQKASAETLRETTKLSVDIANLLTKGINRLTIARTDGPGNLYYTAHLEVNLPVEKVQALDRGIVISHSYYHPSDRQTVINQATKGDIILSRLTIVVPNDLHYVLIDDPLPAGLEAVDPSLITSPQTTAPPTYENQDELFNNGWGWWYFDHVELRDEKIVISTSYLPAGTYIYTYKVRASTPGEFRVIPPSAQEFYFPEVYGRGDGCLFVVKP